MKMSVMRYDGLQGQPFWMQNDQLANSPQFCLKTSAILDTSRRNSQRNFSLHDDQLASPENMQANDNPFNDDIDNDNLKGTKNSKRRKSSSNHITRQKLLRLSGLETESKHLASSPFSDGGESKSHSEDEDERVNPGSVRSRMLSGENQLRREEGAVDLNNCDTNSEMDDAEMETGNEDLDNVEDDEILNTLEEDEDENLRRNNGVELNLDHDSNNFDAEFERDCPSGKGGNSEDELGLVSARNKILYKQDSAESEACNASDRRHSIASSITRLSQAMLDAKANNNVSTACSSGSSRRNKRKNFKPRNIIYQYDVCEDGENELIDDYQLALSNWEMSSQQQKNPLRYSPNVRTSSESPPPVSSKEEEEENGRARENDQPLDLSDNAFLTEQVKEEPSAVYHKHHSRKQKTRRYPGPSESKNSKSPNAAATTTGAAMDLTMTSRTDDEKSVNLSNKFISRGGTGAAMDLSSGNFASVYNAMSNYATGLTTVLASSECNSASVTTNSDQINVNTNTGVGNSSNARSLTSLPKIPPMVKSGITASLLELVAAGGPSSPSKRNAKAAAAAAAAHAAAISLAQAVREREEGNPDGSGGILSAFPPNLDASSIKDYAESTMKELLGLYGFNDMVESFNKDSVSNYFSADMLESMSNTLGLLPSRVSLLPSLLPRSMPPSSMQSSTSRNSPPLSYQGKSNLSSGRTGQMNSSNITSSPTETIPSTSSQPQINEDMYESLHNQVVGGMAKLANLPSGSVVGNPRAILPSNMNSILSLAAMQKNKQVDVPSSSPSPTPNFTPKSSVSTAPSRARNSSSGMTSGIFQDQRKSTPIDYSRYVKRYVKMRLLRFSSSAECGNNSCKDLNYREHFHCLDCNSRVFIKKEEMIRHFKWHKKRDESLQHGFLRYSPMDDCSEKFPNCAHNRKQTHYHCLMYKDGCDKCYISTSDVQMHANYHRKDSAIIQEGFQRFRATEDCGLSICAFSGQRTTHFHCRRSGCNFTFKNKADMEKHKTYHIKDEQLNKDGFKKFMKHECCNFESCRFSRVCNHIHCIRPGCNYVLHSSGQLYSHKRKHERRDNEMAYRKFKLAQSMMRSIGDNQGLSMQSMGDDMKHGDSLPPPSSSPGPSVCSPSSSSGLPSIGLPSSTSSLTTDNVYNSALQQSFSKYSAMLEAASANGQIDSSIVPYGLTPGNDPFSLLELSADFLKSRSDDSWRKYLSRFTANDPCKTNCDFIYKDHYHCNAENCTMVFRSKDGVREHARNHELQDQVTDAFYTTVDGGAVDCCPADCPYQNKQRHYHCGWQNCRETILAVDKPFRRLDHYKMHEYSHKLNFSKEPVPLNITSCSSIDGIFRRKRGRPPKNRTVEFPVSSGSSEYPQAIYTSFKLPKLNHMTGPGGGGDNLPSPFGNMGSSSLSKNLSPGAQSLVSGQMSPIMMSNKVEDRDSFQVFGEGAPCPLKMCSYYGKLHSHCMHPRCFYATDRSEIAMLHWKEVHENQDFDFMDGFTFYNQDIDCQNHACNYNKISRHFHCCQLKCNQSFVNYSIMSQHLESHRIDTIQDEKTNETNYKKMLTHVKREPSSPHPSLCPSTSSRSPSPANSSKLSNVVKASGTFYPLSAFPQSYKKKEDIKAGVKHESNYDMMKSSSALNSDFKWIKNEDSSVQSNVWGEWKTMLESHVAYSAERSCGRSTCKFKNRDHFHCTYCNQAFPKLSLLQPHLQKHLNPSANEMAKNLQSSCSDDEFSDRAMEDEDDDADGLMNSQHIQDSSDDSDSSSNRFAPSNYRHSSPSADSTPSSHNQSYGPFTGAVNHLANDLLHTFPHVADHLQMNPLANFLNPSGGNIGSAMLPQDFRAHSQAMTMSSSLHPNGSSGHMEMNAGEHSSPASTPPGSGAASSVESYGSNPSSPHLQYANQKHFSAGSSNHLDIHTSGGGDDLCETKKGKMTGLRLLRDEPVPEGYIRYRFNEDCRYTHCGYREHQTHFHCMRKDCGYSFCDKTRFVQHTARHERLDTLMGGDFQQFRAQVACGRSECVYITAPGHLANKASHFHCLKCDFVCTDTNKVVAHRRQHQKLDSITAAGFEKYSAQQSCNNDGCSHNQRQTHYHCVKCQYSVMGLSQMSAHKYRHLEGQ